MTLFFMDFGPKWSQNGAKSQYSVVTFWHQKSILFRRGSFVGPLASFWLPSGSILVAFGTLSAPFWSILAPFSVKNNPVRYPFRTTSAKNRRHLHQRKSPLHACLLPGHVRNFAVGTSICIDPHVAGGQRACLSASKGSFSEVHPT